MPVDESDTRERIGVGTEYERGQPVFRTTYDPTSESPVVNIARTLAAASGREVKDLPPLAREIDLDGLVAVLASGDEQVAVEFVVDGWAVSVDGAGHVAVRRATPRTN